MLGVNNWWHDSQTLAKTIIAWTRFLCKWLITEICAARMKNLKVVKVEALSKIKFRAKEIFWMNILHIIINVTGSAGFAEIVVSDIDTFTALAAADKSLCWLSWSRTQPWWLPPALCRWGWTCDAVERNSRLRRRQSRRWTAQRRRQ